ncbi:MAG: 50S ribosomal protein L23 [bacterium]
MNSKRILIQPNISEKSYRGSEVGVYTFRVVKEAKKDDVKREVERKFKVKVEKVRMINKRGKKVIDWRRRIRSNRSDYKHAIVTLKSGNTIDIFKA